MKKYVSGILIVMALATLSGCQHDSSAVGSDGRPHAPSGQASLAAPWVLARSVSLSPDSFTVSRLINGPVAQ
ncbi:hypothetical protein VRC02_06325 [Erwinia sp. E_sp_B01_3]|uniref:hypothetical protein n=1 Tax=Erwinia sp. E_sp_B01_3 TaxID=3039402 RepID=UPI0030D4CBDB